jgi:hypothetical protein
VFYVEGRKIVQFNYYQQLGPYGQKWAFIEGIGPNFGVYPLRYTDHIWAALLATYIRDGKTYDFQQGVLPEPVITPYYSVMNIKEWRQFVISDENPMIHDGDDYYIYDTAYERVDITDYYMGEIDTLFNGMLSTKLSTSETNDTVYFKQTSNCTQLYASFNDTTASKFKLIYDISLETGEAFSMELYVHKYNDYWEWVDTTLYVDTIYYTAEGRKIVQFDHLQKLGVQNNQYNYLRFWGPQYLCFIEGVGSNNGIIPLNSQSDYAFGHLIYAAHKNGSYSYSSGSTIVSTPSIKSISITAYPNPASDYIWIDGLSHYQTYLIHIYNINGSRVLNTLVNNNRVNISHLPNGIYIYKIANKQQFYTGKIMIER